MENDFLIGWYGFDLVYFLMYFFIYIFDIWEWIELGGSYILLKIFNRIYI